MDRNDEIYRAELIRRLERKDAVIRVLHAEIERLRKHVTDLYNELYAVQNVSRNDKSG